MRRRRPDCVKTQVTTGYNGSSKEEGAMLTKLSIGFTFVLLLPWIASAGSLPEGGGDPGKAYKACVDAVAKPDKAGMIDLCFVKDDAWLKAKNLGYFTNETFQVEVRQ